MDTLGELEDQSSQAIRGPGNEALFPSSCKTFLRYPGVTYDRELYNRAKRPGSAAVGGGPSPQGISAGAKALWSRARCEGCRRRIPCIASWMLDGPGG